MENVENRVGSIAARLIGRRRSRAARVRSFAALRTAPPAAMRVKGWEPPTKPRTIRARGEWWRLSWRAALHAPLTRAPGGALGSHAERSQPLSGTLRLAIIKLSEGATDETH